MSSDIVDQGPLLNAKSIVAPRLITPLRTPLRDAGTPGIRYNARPLVDPQGQSGGVLAPHPLVSGGV